MVFVASTHPDRGLDRTQTDKTTNYLHLSGLSLSQNILDYIKPVNVNVAVSKLLLLLNHPSCACFSDYKKGKQALIIKTVPQRGL